MNNVSKIIKQQTGSGIREFCDNELKTQYKAFVERVKQYKLYPAEIIYIVYRTKKPVQEVFGKTWQELFILSQGGGEIVSKVKKLLEDMSEKEKAEMNALLGFGTPKIIEARKKVLKKKDLPSEEEIRKHPLTEEESVKPEKPKSLDDFFVDTY